MSQTSSSPLQVRPRGQQLERRREAVAQVERDDVDGELSGLDLREVENVVDDGQQRLAGRLDHVQILALLGAEVRAERELGHADDAVQRRANLVAHVGQKLALRAVGGFGRVLRAFPLHDLGLEGLVGAQERTRNHSTYRHVDEHGGHDEGCRKHREGQPPISSRPHLERRQLLAQIVRRSLIHLFQRRAHGPGSRRQLTHAPLHGRGHLTRVDKSFGVSLLLSPRNCSTIANQFAGSSGAFGATEGSIAASALSVSITCCPSSAPRVRALASCMTTASLYSFTMFSKGRGRLMALAGGWKKPFGGLVPQTIFDLQPFHLLQSRREQETDDKNRDAQPNLRRDAQIRHVQRNHFTSSIFTPSVFVAGAHVSDGSPGVLHIRDHFRVGL